MLTRAAPPGAGMVVVRREGSWPGRGQLAAGSWPGRGQCSLEQGLHWRPEKARLAGLAEARSTRRVSRSIRIRGGQGESRSIRGSQVVSRSIRRWIMDGRTLQRSCRD